MHKPPEVLPRSSAQRLLLLRGEKKPRTETGEGLERRPLALSLPNALGGTAAERSGGGACGGFAVGLLGVRRGW